MLSNVHAREADQTPPCTQGFFYNRYAPPATAELGTETDTNKDQQLWYHLVGAPQSADKWVYAVPEHPDWFISAEVTDDGRWVVWGLLGLLGLPTSSSSA